MNLLMKCRKYIENAQTVQWRMAARTEIERRAATDLIINALTNVELIMLVADASVKIKSFEEHMKGIK